MLTKEPWRGPSRLLNAPRERCQTSTTSNRVHASHAYRPQHTRRCCRIPYVIMYGMNQAYNVPDPSAQVPNHLVSTLAPLRPAAMVPWLIAHSLPTSI